MKAYFMEYIKPQAKNSSLFFDLATIVGGSCLIALMAQISIPLWFTPVPITMQTFALLLLAGLIGRQRAFMASLLYLAEGAMGLPVFASGGFGLAVLLGPKMGYLLGFPLCAYLVGYLLERGWKRTVFLTFCAMILGLFFVYFFGVLCLSFFVGSMSRALALGCYPFIIGCLLKATSAALLIPMGWKALSFFKTR